MKYILEQQGYRTSVAGNGKEALALVNERKPKLVISDILMPGMDGYTLCKKIKSYKHTYNIPVILLTSLSDPSDVIMGLECGADNFITKPYDEEYLLSCINQILMNQEITRSEKFKGSLEFFFAGKKYFINSQRQQILSFLLATYETAVQKNLELIQAQDELRMLNEQLEEKIEERTGQLKKLNQELEASRASFFSIVEKNVDGIVIVDKEGAVKFVNRSTERLLNRSTENMIDSQFGFPLAAGKVTEIEIARHNGEKGTAEMRVIETNWYGKSAYLVLLRDITETVQLRDQLCAMSLCDELTGLYNRRGFLSMAEQQLKIASRTRNEMLLFFADIDQMKWINDTFGHNEGDRALIKIADILKNTFRGSDIIARIGGDEFVILAINAPKHVSKILTTRLHKNIEEQNAKKTSRYTLSLSMGISYYNPEAPSSINELISQADLLMYEHKNSKKNNASNADGLHHPL